MPHLSRRTQILLDDARHDRLAREAASRGASVAELIREAIDHAFPSTSAERQEAVSAFLQEAAANPIPASDSSELRDEILSAHEPTLDRS